MMSTETEPQGGVDLFLECCLCVHLLVWWETHNKVWRVCGVTVWTWQEELYLSVCNGTFCCI